MNYKLSIIFSCLLWLLCASCVDEYNAELPGNDTQMLVVEGNIVGDQTCTFYLSRSLGLTSGDEGGLGFFGTKEINDADVEVVGEDKSHYVARMTDYGVYKVDVGTLNPQVRYFLEIYWKGETYRSQASYPLISPAIESVSWAQPHDDKRVNVMVTPAPNDDPNQKLCFEWSMEECWEIHTPLQSRWDVSAEGAISDAPRRNIGWHEPSSQEMMVGTSSDYVNNQVKNFTLKSIDYLNNRFNHRYYMRVKQRVISEAEYEYQSLCLKQSSDMGGLFTPQPSELPSNIRCVSSSNVKAVGFVGVSANASEGEIYISSSAVGYRLTRTVEYLEDELCGEDPYGLHLSGWRMISYDILTGEKKWAKRWCVDACDFYWDGTTYERPSFWIYDD